MASFKGYENIPGAPGNLDGLAQSFFDSPVINTEETEIAGYLTDSDKQVLRDHANMLKKIGTPYAERELREMNKRYSQYGLSFGSTQLPGV